MKKNDFQTKELSQSLNNSELVLFIGAGLSIGAGLPGWYQLITELTQQIDYELPPPQWIMSETLIDGAQAYINSRGLNNLVRFLRNALDTTSRQPTVSHQALVSLPVSLVFTANYDDLLERAFREAGKRVNLVVRDNDIPLMSNEANVVNIVKMYGDLNQPTTIVLAREQYERYFLERPQMVKLLEMELSRSDILYLGWSHTDLHFNLVFGELLNRFDSLMRSGYAVMGDLPESKLKEFERKHIHIIQLPTDGDRNSQLANWLSSLISTKGATTIGQDKSVSQPATPQPSPTSSSAQPIPDIAIIRQMLVAAFDDEEFVGFCSDYFSSVYNNFSTGMTKGHKIQLLLDYCSRQGELPKLLQLVQASNPYQYSHFIKPQ